MDTLELSELANKTKINQLINSDLIDDNSKKQLTKYKKMISGSKVSVLYKFSRNGDRGRIFAKGSLSLQMFWRNIRHTLASDIYDDIDIVNAHPTFLKQLCDKNLWNCEQLSDYIEHRESLLKQIEKHYNIDRDNAKKSINSIINGGNSLADSMDFIKKFKDEMAIIRNNVANSEPELVKYVGDKRRKDNRGEFNFNGSVMNIKLCEIENNILLEMVKFFRSKEFIIGVLCFDGLMIEKNDKLTTEILEECCEYIKQTTGYSIKLINKPMNEGFDMKIFDNEDYQNVKHIFEKEVFKVNEADCFIRIINDDIKIINTKSLNHIYQNKWCYLNGERQKFIKLWLEDQTIKTYEKIDFLPYPRICGDDIFNLYTGLAGEKLMCDNYDEQEIEPILNHIRKLSGNDPNSFNYFIKWLADMVKNPGKLNGVSIVLRSDEGAGKNIFLDFFGNKIIGNMYYFTTGDPEHLFGRFANGRKNKLLVNLDETSGADGFKFSEKIKNFITSETTQFEQKGVDPLTMQNYARWIFSTNNETPVKVSLSDRRFVIFDCDNSICKNEKYFKALYECFNDDNKCAIFYKYLMNIDVSNFSPINDRPITDAYQDIQSVNTPVLYHFLDYYMNTITTAIGRKTVKELFDDYKKYCDENGYTCKYNTFSIGRALKKVIGIDSCVSGSVRGYTLNKDQINTFLSKFIQ